MEKAIICPICQSDKTKKYFVKNNFQIYNCYSCQASFVWPEPENLKNIYNDSYYKNQTENQAKSPGYKDYEKDKEPMQKLFVKYLDKIEKMNSGRKVLDIGGATGYFLDIAKVRGWETFGLEISDFARNQLRIKGHKVLSENLNFSDDVVEVDLITMWDVLEHINDPVNFIRKHLCLLKKGGYIIINTINKSSLWAKILGKKWPAIIPPEHLIFFSKPSLEKIINIFNLEMIEFHPMGKRFSLSYIFKVLFDWQGIILWKKLSYYFDNNFWRKVSLPINLRDNILIIAKKND